MALRDSEKDVIRIIAIGLAPILKELGRQLDSIALETAATIIGQLDDDVIISMMSSFVAGARTDEVSYSTGGLDVVDERIAGAPAPVRNVDE